MRELHVVATSDDGRHVVLATRKGAANGDYRVALDDRLAAAVRGDLPRPGEAEPVGVTPKEIQARLRAGESPEQIAAAAGVPITKIDRYAGPVLSERERVISQARAGFVSRSRLGASALPLGEAVDRHLAETTGVRPETIAWSARREDSGSWLVELTYVSQARRRTATWRYDIAKREVTATDTASATLAHVEPGRGGRSAEVAPVASVVAPASRARRAPVRTAAPKKKAAAARKVATRPAPPVRAAAPVPRAAAPAKAAQAAAQKAAAAAAARAQAARALAQERAASAAAAQAARETAAAEQAAAEQARAARARAAKAEEARKAKAEAARKAKAEEARKAKAEAARKAKAEEARKAKAEAARKAKAEEARKAKAEAARKAKVEEARKAKAQEDKKKKAAEAAREAAEQAPTHPPTLRVVGADDAPAPARRGPKEPPAAARTTPARAAGQRASVPGWADVLLSTAPVARPAEPDPDEG